MINQVSASWRQVRLPRPAHAQGQAEVVIVAMVTTRLPTGPDYVSSAVLNTRGSTLSETADNIAGSGFSAWFKVDIDRLKTSLER